MAVWIRAACSSASAREWRPQEEACSPPVQESELNTGDIEVGVPHHDLCNARLWMCNKVFNKVMPSLTHASIASKISLQQQVRTEGV